MSPARLALSLALSALLALSLLAPVAAEEDAAEPTDGAYPTEPVVVGTQRAGTFGDDPEVAAIGTALGADLREARISMPDPETVVFEIEVEELPSLGGTPEVIRYTWDMTIDGEVAQIDGKFSNYSRGTCDPTSGQCDPTEGKMPRDPGERPFMFRGNLNQLDLAATTFNAMEELDLIPADFDVDTATITVTVPVATIDLLEGVEFGPCSRILPGAGIFGGTVETAPSAFLSYGSFPSDTIVGVASRGTFVAPPAADAEVDCAGNPIG
jgi:hypothetical protein